MRTRDNHISTHKYLIAPIVRFSVGPMFWWSPHTTQVYIPFKDLIFDWFGLISKHSQYIYFEDFIICCFAQHFSLKFLTPSRVWFSLFHFFILFAKLISEGQQVKVFTFQVCWLVWLKTKFIKIQVIDRKLQWFHWKSWSR